MTEISNVTITYNEVTYDGNDYCEISITGIAKTDSPGRYAIVRHAVGCADEYAMEIFESTGGETVSFAVNDVINIEGGSSDFHPTTGEVTDLYLVYNSAQVCDAYRFTVGDCISEDEEDNMFGMVVYTAIGAVGIATAIIIIKEMV